MTGRPGWRARRALGEAPDPFVVPLLLVGLVVSSAVLLLVVGTPSGVPTVWPAPGLLLSLALVAEPRCRSAYVVTGASCSCWSTCSWGIHHWSRWV